MLAIAVREPLTRQTGTAQMAGHFRPTPDRRQVRLAKEMREATAQGGQLGLNDDEIAFDDARGVNDSAVQLLGGELIVRELAQTPRRNVTIDRAGRESVCAQPRMLVKRILRKYENAPDKQERAVQTVLTQAETLSVEWAEA